MHDGGDKWLLILTLLLLLVLGLGLFLYRSATNLAEAICGCMVFSVFLLLALLIPLEILISDLVGGVIYYTLSELGNMLLAPFDRWYNTLSKTASILRYAFFFLSLAVILYETLFIIIAENLPPCQSVLPKLIETPFDTKFLSKCPFTKPLTKIVSGDLNDIPTNANNLLSVLIEYVDLFQMDILSFGIAVAFASGIPRQLWGRLFVATFITLGRDHDVDLWTRKQNIRIKRLRRFGRNLCRERRHRVDSVQAPRYIETEVDEMVRKLREKLRK